jgi:hypothetical protein
MSGFVDFFWFIAFSGISQQWSSKALDNPANRGAPTCTEFGNGGAVGRFMCYLDHLQATGNSATAPTDYLPTYKRQPH